MDDRAAAARRGRFRVPADVRVVLVSRAGVVPAVVSPANSPQPPPPLELLLDPELLLVDPLPDPLLEPLLDPELLPLLLPLLDPELLLLDPPPGTRSAVPFGEPQPVGPSKPAPALQKYGVVHCPLLPEVTSKNFVGLAQTYEGAELTPRMVNAAATSGADALVPPYTPQLPPPPESLQ